MPASRVVKVVGAGVIGLTTAIRLLEQGLRIEVLADRHRPNTTSNVAAGLWYPYKAGGDRVARWALESLDVYRLLAIEEETGVRMVHSTSYVPADQPRPFWADADVDYRDVSVHGLAGEAPRQAILSRLPVAQSDPFTAWLESRVDSLGGRIRILERPVVDFSDVEASIIVNCTGLGARGLCGDDSVFPIRGVTVRVRGTGIDECITDDVDPEVPTYIIPSSGFCVLGGSAEPDRWDVSVSEEEIRDVLDRCARLDDRVRDGAVVGVAAGLRPGRSEVRLEIEHLDDGRTIVHNYGHGGSGFTLAWGCAKEAAELVSGLAG